MAATAKKRMAPPQGAVLVLLQPRHGLPKGAVLRPVRVPRDTPKGKPSESAANGSKIGSMEPESGKLVLHEGESARKISRAAAAEHDAAKAALESALRAVPGAKLAGDRPKKDLERVGEKVENGHEPETVRDYSGFRVGVETPEAWKRTAAALRAHFEVPDEQDQFEKGSEENFHGHTVQIRMPGSQVTHEVQILPREVAEHADDDHELYEDARDGDTDAMRRLKDTNRERWIAFQDRNGTAQYKMGSTQAELHPESEAGKALAAAQAKVKDEDLAGKGRDVGGAHVTLRYGVQGGDPEKIRAYLRKQPPFDLELGPTESFPPSENSEGAAVIMAPVTSPALERMHREIAAHGKFAEPNFAQYKPHATVAYVKPEAAQRYTGMKETAGKRARVGAIHLTFRDGSSDEVPLEGREDSDQRAADSSQQPAASGRKPPRPPAHRMAAMGPGTEPEAEEEPRMRAPEPPGKAQKAGTAGEPIKKGDIVVLEDGRRAETLYAPRASMPVPMYRFRDLDNGRRLEMRGSRVDAGGARKAQTEEGGGWIGVDLDKTLAHYDGFKGPEVIGEPIAKSVRRVKRQLQDGRDVRILTARVSDDPGDKARRAITAWAEKHVGRRVPVTDRKDSKMTHLYDDRAVPVKANEGSLLARPQKETKGA